MKLLLKPLPLFFALLLVAELQLGEPVRADELSLSAADLGEPSRPLQIAGLANYHDGSFIGPVVGSYYGDVQVKVTVSGGRIVGVAALQFPAERNTSRRINAVALPRLESEVIRAQSARINAVTGATVTSDAYLKSLASALRQASA